jgi:hypothetical protein
MCQETCAIHTPRLPPYPSLLPRPPPYINESWHIGRLRHSITLAFIRMFAMRRDRARERERERDRWLAYTGTAVIGDCMAVCPPYTRAHLTALTCHALVPTGHNCVDGVVWGVWIDKTRVVDPPLPCTAAFHPPRQCLHQL